MRDAVDYYRQVNKLRDNIDWSDPFTDGRYRQFAKHIKSRSVDVLDLGCHTGAGGRTLKPLLPHLQIVGMDVCPEFVAALPSGIYEMGIAATATAINANDESFDVVLAGETIEHLFDVDVEPAIRECYRVLRPKGQLLLTTPNPTYFKLLLTGKSVLGGSHLSQHKAIEVRKLLATLGFQDIQVRGSGRMSQVLGESFPILSAYGSYLVVATKP